MENSPQDVPRWAKALGIILLTAVAVTVAGTLVALGIKLVIWAWSGVF
jgi:hypothetical protein